ncbi:MAG: NAD(+) synthase [Acetatifactor sp.]|nr:NAD(+) synthase [Acetatifactor sp.]
MRDGFIKVAAMTPKIKVADPVYNTEKVIEDLNKAYENKSKIIVFPELVLTGYTCNDLFLQPLLLQKASEGLSKVVKATSGHDSLVFVGLPLEKDGRLYNVAAVISDGELLGFVTKRMLPTYAEFYEERHFTEGPVSPEYVLFEDSEVPFGSNILFDCVNVPGLMVGAEICEDLWVADTPSTSHALAGASVIVNLSASNETVSKDEYRQLLVKATSARLLCGYIYASAGDGESTQDLVFSGHNLIAENGRILAESKLFENDPIYSEIDVNRIRFERRRMSTFGGDVKDDYVIMSFRLNTEETMLTRTFAKTPFVPGSDVLRNKRCEEILAIQANGLKKRLEATGCKNAVIGISGGLDSTLALLVTAKAFDLCGLDRKGIVGVTMPCFGTTDRTHSNALNMTKALDATLIEVDIKEAVTIHFRDIGQDPENHDVTYENCQARERTQVLMDMANKTGGMVIGTGDMSELALGWATYNGDHMSMYGVNASVPKTLVRHLVKYYADTCGNAELTRVLLDVLDTPVSPELLPPKDGVISQKTEDLVGPYELHDFFLYHMLRCGYEPKKVFRIALSTFEDSYDRETILKWLKSFYRRFFAQQFKRSCIPDGPKVGSVALSPRGDLRMPSDASANIWLQELDNL